MFALEKVKPNDAAAFRTMVLAYWHEIMPASDVLKDATRQEAYFNEEFTWTDENRHPHWALLNGRRIGFVNFAVFRDQKRAEIVDFYIVPEQRRQGNGTGIVCALFRYFDANGVERIDLNVRRDAPNALIFWQAQGFGIAGYRLRQYRDPNTGTAFRGALSSDFTPTEPTDH